MSTSNVNPLGSFLRDRRAKLDPASLGLSLSRRRTPGLRREEFAQRANISATWYTWLEQGRGGAPSADVLDRIARALLLTDSEREHLFVLGLGRPPGLRHRSDGGVTPRLQRVLDAMALSPAIVKTPTWDVVAWNRAAAAVLTDYGTLAPDQRNILRLIFCDPRVRAQQFDWEQVARFVVAAFRADAARAGQSPRFELLIEELSRASSDFKAMWESGEVVNFGEGAKRLRHPELGQIAFEYSTFAVDGRPDLSMVVYNPATTDDAARVQSLIEAQGKSVPIL